jgi:hypothetical protein
VRHQRRRAEDVLEVVQDEEQAALPAHGQREALGQGRLAVVAQPEGPRRARSARQV